MLNDIDDEIARPDARVKNLRARCGQRLVKLTPEHLIDAGHHELDDLLRCVDNAQRIGLLDRKALEETLIDGVEELLTLAPGFDALGCRLDFYFAGLFRLTLGKIFCPKIPVRLACDKR